jgi:hypothetical protein
MFRNQTGQNQNKTNDANAKTKELNVLRNRIVPRLIYPSMGSKAKAKDAIGDLLPYNVHSHHVPMKSGNDPKQCTLSVQTMCHCLSKAKGAIGLLP